MLAYTKAWVTFFVATLALCACNQKKGNSTMDAPPPQSMRQFEVASNDHGPTAWDEAGFQKFRISNGNAVEAFYAQYAGRFPEDTPKVNGYLEIQRGRLALKAGGNLHRPKEPFCTINLDAKIETITRSYTGYVLWIRPDANNKACLLARVEGTDIQQAQGRVGLSLDYYNANTLRLSLQDAYIFFLRAR